MIEDDEGKGTLYGPEGCKLVNFTVFSYKSDLILNR